MQDELTPLLDAVLSIAQDVELDGVLDRVVRASREMVGAEYAALGVLDDDGDAMASFLHVGIDDATAAAIGPLPTGRGVLGELITNPEPLALERLSDHPASVPLPPGHPPMTTFLGVPVRVGDEVFGNLYLTDKPGGFTDDDRRLVIAFAAVAGAAIRNARAVQELALRARLDHAVADVATVVLGGASVPEGLTAASVAAAELAGVDPAQVELGRGRPGTLGATHRAAGHVTVRISTEGDLLRLPEVTDTVLAELSALASRAGIALGYARARDEVERLAVRLDRERIARDLHDTVIQRLFGAGLRLDGLSRQLDDVHATGIVETVIGELDAAIGELRATIAAMHDPGPLPVPDRLRAVVGALQPVTTGLRPLTVTGDTARVADDVASDLVAVLREGITNATRHARARSITPSLLVSDDIIELTVRDDGVGPPSTDERPGDGRGLGLGNLDTRATRHGGGSRLTSNADGPGAQLVWWVPLAPA